MPAAIGAVAQRERRHVDRLAPEADVDRDAGGEPLTVDAVVLDEAAAPGEGDVAVVVDRNRTDRFRAADDRGTREHLSRRGVTDHGRTSARLVRHEVGATWTHRQVIAVAAGVESDRRAVLGREQSPSARRRRPARGNRRR